MGPLVTQILVVVLAVSAAKAAVFFDIVSSSLAMSLVSIVLVLGVVLGLLSRVMCCLGEGEQLRVQNFTELTVYNGPGVFWLSPVYRSAETVKAKTLAAQDYVKINNTTDGAERIEKGPQLLFLGPYDMITGEGKGMSLSNTEYVKIEDKLTGKRIVQKGPTVWFPGPHDEGKKGKAISLNSTEYVLVEDALSGQRSVITGPTVWFPAPYEEGKKGTAVSLNSTEYLTVEDQNSGERRTVKGPQTWFPGKHDVCSAKQVAIALQDDEYVKLKDTATGRQWIERGEKTVFLEPSWEVQGGVQKAFTLKAFEFIRLHDSTSGKVTVHKGEQTVFPGPHEQVLDGKKMSAVDLKVHEYVKVLDQATSEVRVVRGPDLVFLGPNEKVLDPGKCKAVEIDDDHAALVRDKGTGVQRLVTSKQLFIPKPHEVIEEVRELIKLADHEAMIIKDGAGVFHYYYGSDEKRDKDKQRSFFLPPYAEVVALVWSSGQRRDRRDLRITKFDCRPQYMWFEFNCRTSDNVELVLEGTFFWEVVDLPTMVKATGDTSGDLCNHARSQFIRLVSRVTLKEFMQTLHEIARKVYEEEPSFYAKRGVKVHSLEVTRYQCADKSTSEILEQIIQETTNRMNRLSQQESENEVKLFKIQGQIQQETMQSDLLKIQYEHQKEESSIQGTAEAERVSAFMNGLTGTVPKLEDRMNMWQTLRKTDALSVVSAGQSSIYFTPSDVNLSIESRPN